MKTENSSDQLIGSLITNKQTLIISQKISTTNYNTIVIDEQNQEHQTIIKKNFLQRTFGPIRKGAVRGAILTLLASSMGTGIFNLPQRVSQIGLIPFSFFVIICAIYSYFGMQMMSQIIKKHSITSYSQMTQKAFGSILKRISQFCLIIYPWGITICFQVILAKFALQLIHDYNIFGVQLFKDRKKGQLNTTGQEIRIFINIGTILLSLFFILKRQINTIKKLAYIGVISVLFNVSVVIGTSLLGFNKQTDNPYHGVFSLQIDKVLWSCSLIDNFSILMQGVAAIFFCYVSHQMVFPLVKDLKNPTAKRLTKVFSRTHITLLTTYSGIAIFAYLLLVQHIDTIKIQSLVIASINTQIMALGKSIMILALFVAVSLNMFPARQMFIETFQIDTTQPYKHILVCVALSFSSTLIAITFVQVNSYFGLLGGTAGVMMAGGIPALCYYKLMKLQKKHYFLISFIFIVTILAIIGAIMSVIDLFA